MANSLQALFQAIAQAPDEEALRASVMAKTAQYFTATRRGLIFFDALPPEISAGSLRLAFSVDHNPVLRYLVEHHAPVHEEVLLPPGIWQKICPRSDHGHVMVGPIVSNGQLVGGVEFTRNANNPAFDAQNLAQLSALCLHRSTRLATLRLLPPAPPHSANQHHLTPREIQIAELVTQGLTNAQIGTILWITEHSVKQALKRIFRKLEVSSRAELAAWFSLYNKVSILPPASEEEGRRFLARLD